MHASSQLDRTEGAEAPRNLTATPCLCHLTVECGACRPGERANETGRGYLGSANSWTQ